MAVQTINDPLDPSKPKQIPAPSPLDATPTLLGAPATATPTSTMKPPTAPNINTIPDPNGATAISQLPDGAGGAVTVPPTSLAPNSVVPFDPSSNLIGSQINPTASARLLGAQGAQDAAASAVTNGPDRVALGQQYYNTFAQNAQNQFGHALTDATNAAAAHGQIGSGQLTNRYGDLAQQFNLNNNTAASNFATQALEGTIGDRLNNYGVAQANANNIYGQEAAGRNEVRGERGYQQNLAEQAIAQRIAQQQAEMGAQNQDFNQGLDMYGLGTRFDPTSAYQNAAAMSSAEAGQNAQDTAALMKWIAMNRGTGGF